MHSFRDCRSGWSKEPQWKNDYGSFLPCFLLVLVQYVNRYHNLVTTLLYGKYCGLYYKEGN